ncbi:Calcineurin-like phosphoesterase [Phytophthora cinnamomi]|uniref:Calcineurin-like phosphoesterase n=1 Tax=Phytophthora cinnamomi TaxID=4785 RepID=UPI00355A06C3|nr:Calcineurin-like phosphoesterase [Phytophthora cinnamomi]
MKMSALFVAIAVCSVVSAESTGFVEHVKKFFGGGGDSSKASGSAAQAASRSTGSQDSAVDDNACVYKWSSLSCEPADSCSLQYEFGDMTPSQACRVRDSSDSARKPQQLHLAFAGEEAGTGMTISWTTFVLEKNPAVWIGTSKANVAKVKGAEIETKSYYKDNDYELYSYHAVVTGLKANTEYFYKVGSASKAKFQSFVSSFKTARAAGDESPFTIAVYGDMGADANSVATNKYVNSLVDEVDFVYHLGDISYADNDFLTAKNVFGFFYEQVYNKFMNSMSNVMRQMAYMVLVGNHEAECHSPTCLLSKSKKDQLGNYSAFNSRFRMPSAESGGVLNMWYSYEYGTVHFTSLSSETDYPNAPSNAYFTKRKYGKFGNQLAWLEADLKAADANRENVPWLVVGIHRPMYTIRSCDANGVPNNDYEARNVQEAFEALFIKYKVDLVLQGHVHAYERHYPTANSSAVMDGVSKDDATYTNPQAPVYVISGAAGGPEGHFKYKNPPSPEWLVLMDNKHFGISKLFVTPTNLTLTMIESATGTVYDEFSIVKDAGASQRG